MPYHYTKSGALDMRYSSSKAAVASGYSSSGGGGSSSGYSGSSGYYGASTPSSSTTYSSGNSSSLNYTKDGSLDMRYSSSKAAVASGYSNSGGGGSSSRSSGASGYSGSSGYYSASTPSSSTSYSSGNSSSLHYTKDGSLDMRYSSSKAAVSSGYSGGSSGGSGYNSGNTSSTTSRNNLHHKKDGSLDMRYSSSKQVASFTGNTNDLAHTLGKLSLHHKKDGTLDMRYASSKTAVSGGIGNQTKVKGVPTHIPVTKKGLPDMRTTAAKQWVKDQAQSFQGGVDYLPPWIPRTKDGCVDFSKAVTAEYLKCNGYESLDTSKLYNPCHRQKYYEEKLQQELFRRYVEDVRNEDIKIRKNPLLDNTNEIRQQLTGNSGYYGDNYSGNHGSELLKSIPLIAEKDLIMSSQVLGKGAFGIVTKAKLKGVEVAVKRLHLQNLTRKEKDAFVKEIKILASLGAHPNLVALHGYMLDPPTMVLEFVHLGSLNYLLHYSEDNELEAKMTDGRIKKRIAIGIINGMQQIHGVNIVHGDLKPQNILISKSYQAKITDFGLATLRGKTSSSIESTVTADGDVVIGGTAGYMAPELLGSSSAPQLSIDVYSFGIVLNEMIQEEEPYSDQFKNFLGRGPFAAANYAKLGNRPKIHSRTPSNLQTLIKKCWDAEPKYRPTFDRISKEIEIISFPNSF